MKPLLRIPVRQTFTLSHKSGTWLVSLTIISTHKDSSGKLMNNQLKAYTKQLLKYMKGKKNNLTYNIHMFLIKASVYA